MKHYCKINSKEQTNTKIYFYVQNIDVYLWSYKQFKFALLIIILVPLSKFIEKIDIKYDIYIIIVTSIT